MKKYIIFSIIGLAVVGLTATSAFAYQSDPSVQGPEHTPERHEAMVEAFASNDYNAWQELKTNNRGKIMDVINEDNFSQFIAMRQARLDGDTEAVDAIRAELGLGQGQMQRNDNGNGRDNK